MTTLFRAVYSRNGGAGGMTFGLPSDLLVAERATVFAEQVIMPLARALDPKARLLTVSPYPKPNPYRFPKEGA